jgi:hypothetical protein
VNGLYNETIIKKNEDEDSIKKLENKFKNRIKNFEKMK